MAKIGLRRAPGCAVAFTSRGEAIYCTLSPAFVAGLGSHLVPRASVIAVVLRGEREVKPSDTGFIFLAS